MRNQFQKSSGMAFLQRSRLHMQLKDQTEGVKWRSERGAIQTERLWGGQNKADTVKDPQGPGMVRVQSEETVGNATEKADGNQIMSGF